MTSLLNTNFNQTVRILIVDDHPIVREGLAALLCAQPDLRVCGEAANLAEAVQQMTSQVPDVVIVDIALANENGLDVVRRVRNIDPKVRILVVSMYDDELYAERSLEAGAMGYLNKQTASRNIVIAIRRILAGQRYLSEEIKARLLTRQNNEVPAGARQGIAALSDRELEVFRMIGTGLTTTEIASQLCLSVKTIESHRLNIKSKLNITNAAQLSREATHFVLQNG